MGAEAVLALMEATPETKACVVSIVGNVATRVPLMECVKMTKECTEAQADKNWDLAVNLRGKDFIRSVETYLMLREHKPTSIETGKNLAVMNVGAPCGGINAAIRSFVRTCNSGGHKAIGIYSGIEGLINGEIEEMHWGDVNGWTSQGGALIGMVHISNNYTILSSWICHTLVK